MKLLSDKILKQHIISFESEECVTDMKIKRFLCFTFALFILISSCSGCSKGNKASVIKKFDADKLAESIVSQTVASNDLYKLDWNDEKKCVLLTELSTGKVWSNIPYEYFLSDGASANVNSTLNITVADVVSLQLTTIRGYSEAVQKGRIFSEQIENGIRITYCFDQYQISVPVEYILRDDSMLVNIDTAEIGEGSTHLLVSVSLAPFLCNARNSEENSYLFIPAGSGALMYAEETPEVERTYSGEVYGDDATRPITENFTNDQAIRLPVFGAKDGESAILGIIEKNSGSAFLEAMSGNRKTGYSNVYPTFYVRGYDIFDKEAYIKQRMTDDLIRVSEAITKDVISVGYYPLTKEDADYNGMAKRYRKYLEDNGLLKAEKTEYSPYSVTLSGGVLTTSLIFGIPTKTMKTMTTFSDAQNIVEALAKKTEASPVVRLQGFGNSGINYGKIGGGFDFSSKLGSKNDRKSLEELCEDKNVKLFYDFDLINYAKSGGGFSYISDSAKTAVYKAAEQYMINTPVRAFEDTLPYRILGRKQLGEAVEKLLKTAENKKLKNISLTTLGSVAYSDYSDFTYISKGRIAEDVKEMLESFKGKKINVASGANAYAAAASNVVFDIPTDNGAYNAFDEEIPFYAMVFRGSRPLYTQPINTEGNKEAAVIRAAIGGVGLGFSLIEKFDISYVETGIAKLYGMAYEDNKDFIASAVSNYGKFYKAIENVNIESYEVISENLSLTTFENGVVLYANHSNKTVESPMGAIDAYGYLWK